MSYRQCLSNGLNEGLVTKEQYDEQLEFIGMQERYYKGQGVNPTDASIQAAKDAYDNFKGQALLKKRRNRLQLQRQVEIRRKLSDYRNAKGEPDLNKAAIAIYARDDLANYQSLESAIQEETAIVQRYLDTVLGTKRKTFRKSWFISWKKITKKTNN